MRARRIARSALAVLLGLAASGAGAQIDPFYTDLERDALAARERGEATQAARLYRIACFGMLDEPARLAACTVRLALAQAAAGDRDGFAESFGRLATVEERFQGLTLADLGAGERTELARIAAALLPAETLQAIPVVAELARAAKAAAAKAPASERAKRRREPAKPPRAKAAKVEPVKAPPQTQAQSAIDAPEAVSAPETVPEVAASAEPPAPAPLTAADEDQIAAARALADGRPQLAELEAALGPLRTLADRHPERTDVARLVGDLAYRARLWPVCADYYSRAGDPGPDAPLDRFYMAVCLYETGRREAAAELLAPSAGRLRRSPFVESYLGKILAPPAVP